MTAVFAGSLRQRISPDFGTLFPTLLACFHGGEQHFGLEAPRRLTRLGTCSTAPSFLGRPQLGACFKPRVRSQDDRRPEKSPPLAQKVLDGTTMLTLQHIGQRFQRSPCWQHRSRGHDGPCRTCVNRFRCNTPFRSATTAFKVRATFDQDAYDGCSGYDDDGDSPRVRKKSEVPQKRHIQRKTPAGAARWDHRNGRSEACHSADGCRTRRKDYKRLQNA